MITPGHHGGEGRAVGSDIAKSDIANKVRKRLIKDDIPSLGYLDNTVIRIWHCRLLPKTSHLVSFHRQKRS